MLSEPLWLPAKEIVENCRYAVGLTGEPFQILSADLVESAAERPRNLYFYGGERDTLTLAVSLLFSVVRNHPFQQGNKRAGFFSAVMFLEMNGYALTVDDSELLGELILEVIDGAITEGQFTEILRDVVAEIAKPSGE